MADAIMKGKVMRFWNPQLVQLILDAPAFFIIAEVTVLMEGQFYGGLQESCSLICLFNNVITPTFEY